MYVRELTKRKYRGKQSVEIRGPEDVFQFLKGRFEHLDREHFLIVPVGCSSTK